ncbi:hypothetical protein ACDZ28_26475 [Paenibacillus sp. RS8]|uniref:hypothetical protein n=1 Tax=Paenibacillus sp. RS8 TaxID=3242681 RepID=UPI0035BF37B1
MNLSLKVIELTGSDSLITSQRQPVNGSAAFVHLMGRLSEWDRSRNKGQNCSINDTRGYPGGELYCVIWPGY